MSITISASDAVGVLQWLLRNMIQKSMTMTRQRAR